MIETRTYEGDAGELARFAQRVWRGSYEGRMMLPMWDDRYFNWQLLAERPGGRDFLVTAYDGGQLVGSLLGERFRFRLHDREFDATMGSWLTVDPEYRRQGVGTLLFEEQRRRHLDQGAIFNLGYGYTGAAVSLGPRFWKSFPANTVDLGKVGFWARVLDHRTVARWDLARRDRWGARLLGCLQPWQPRPRDRDGVRAYRAADLPDCLRLAHGLLDRVDMGYVWDEARLAHQLQYRDTPRTLVFEKQGRIEGLVNYYCLDFLGRFRLPAAMIDLAAFGDATAAERRKLVFAALEDMAAAGVKLALMLRLPCYESWTLWRTGFVPLPADFRLLCVRMDTTFPLDGARRMHLHWR